MRKFYWTLALLSIVFQGFTAELTFKANQGNSFNNPSNWFDSNSNLAVNRLPNADDIVVINSDFSGNEEISEILISQNIIVKGLLINENTNAKHFIFTNNAQLKVGSEFISYSTTKFSGSGSLLFSGEPSEVGQINLSLAKIEIPVYTNGNWAFDGFATVKNGLNIQNGSVTVKSGDWVINSVEPGSTQNQTLIIEGGNVYYNDLEVETIPNFIKTSGSGNLILPSKGEPTGGSRNIVSCGFPPLDFQIEAVITSDYNGRAISCNGANDANVSVIVSPAGNYSFQWDDGPSTQDWNGRGPGFAVVLVTNLTTGVDCQAILEVPDTPPLLLPSIGAISLPVCVDDCNGVYGANVSGGTQPYTWTWNADTGNEFIGNPATNICRGVNTVRVTDVNGCSRNRDFNVILPLDFFANPDVTNVSCFGETDGSITLNPDGSNGGPFTYLWEDGQDTQTISGLAAGSYSVTIFDIEDCVLDTTITISQPDQILINIESSSNLLCFEDCIGAIETSFTGGVEPFSFQWFNTADDTPVAGQDNQNAENLCAGSYYLRIEDENGCVGESSPVIITQPDEIILDEIITNVNCFGFETGSIQIIAQGGVEPYQLSLTDSEGASIPLNETEFPNPSFINLPAGNYSFTLTDINNCVLNRNYTITQNEELVFTAEAINLSCADVEDGSITITGISGGVEPYSFNWTLPGGATSTDQNLDNLASGNYSVVVSDAVGCIAEESFELMNPPIISATAEITDVSCFGLFNGEIILSPSGGTPNPVAPFYSFSWSGPNDYESTNQNINGLEAGNYTTIITDSRNCTQEFTFNVSQPNLLEASGIITNVDCNANTNGSVILSVLGGTEPYDFIWTQNGNQVATTQNLEDVTAGLYTVNIIDDNDCQLSLDFEILEPNTLEATISRTNVSCNGENDGTITLIVSGGTEPYDISWTSNTGFTGTGLELENLSAGNYTATIIDANDCSTEASIQISEPSVISVTPTLNNPTCNGLSNGSISIIVTGGTGDYLYQWTGPNDFEATTQNISGLIAGEYELLVTDENNCTFEATYSLNEPLLLTASGLVQNISCFGNGDGSIVLTVQGGTPNYSFEWLLNGIPFFNGQNPTNLNVGNYTVNISDNNNCETTLDFTITEPTPLNVDVSSSNIDCNGLSNGTINLDISGGSAPYQISVNGPGGFTSFGQTSLTNLGPGDYEIFILDQNDCSFEQTVTIEEPQELGLNILRENPSCTNTEDGNLEVQISGGTPPYVIEWSGPGGITFDELFWEDLAAGEYSILVTDANGCSTDTFILVSGGSFATDGVQLAPPPTDPNFVFTSSINISNFEAGQTLTDPSQLISICLNLEHAWMADLEMRILCPNGQFTSLYRFPNTGNEFNSCGGSTNLGIPINRGNTPNFSGFDYCFTEDAGITMCDAGVPLAGTQSLPAGNYLPDGDFSDLIGCPLNGDWTVSIRDVFPAQDNGFLYNWTIAIAEVVENVNTVTLTAPDPIDITADITETTCAGGLTDGAISITINGGTQPFEFSWTGPNGFTSGFQNISNLSAGVYVLTVTDNNNCEEEFTFELLDPDPIVLNGSVSDVLCFGDANGSASVTINGGEEPFAIEWVNINNPGIVISSANSITNVAAGTYQVTVVDSRGCEESLELTIGSPNELEITSVNVTPIPCTAPQEGSISIVVAGGTPNYTFSWEFPDGSTSNQQNLNGLTQTGVYSVTVTDALFCSVNQEIQLLDAENVTVGANVTNNLCFGETNGAIEINIIDGDAPFTFSWNGPNGFTADTQSIAGLSNGSYTLTILDGNLCSSQFNYQITSLNQIFANETITNIDCATDPSGAISVAPSGGAGGFTYAWTGPDSFVSNTQNISNVVAGIYNLIITDQQNCSENFSFEIESATTINVDFIISNIDCNGDLVNVEATISGGQAPYNFSWTGPDGFTSTSLNLENLEVGIYTISGEDATGCEFSETLDISEPNVLRLFVSITNVTCFDGEDGAINLTILGGTAPYTVEWTLPDGSTSSDVSLSDIPSGDYTVLVTDANGCEESNVVSIGGGEFDGGFLALPDGTGVSYSTSIVVNDFTPGQSINDANNFQFICINMEHSWLGDLEIALECPSGQRTVLKAFPGGGGTVLGLPNFPDDGNPIPGVGFDYCFTNEPDFGLLVNTPTTYTHLGRQGRPEGTYTPAQPFSNFIGCPLNGAWTLEITDFLAIDNGFVFNWSIGLGDGSLDGDIVTINQPNDVTVTPTINNVSCAGGNEGSIDILAFGGTAPLNFNWSGPNGFSSTQQSISGLTAGQYNLNITDANNCSFGPFTYQITQPDEIQIAETILPPTCDALDNGSINTIVTGGTAPYTYNWTLPGGGSSDAENIINATSGTYSLSITDALGCIFTEEFEVIAPDPIVLNEVLTPPTCIGDTDGSIEINPSGGTAPYDILWVSLGVSDLLIENLEAGNYTVEITDANGCFSEQTITLNPGSSLNLSVVSNISTSCGNNDGSAQIAVSGGNAPFTFQWSIGGNPVPEANGGNSNVVTNVGSGAYLVNVSDANGCSNSISVGISDIDGPEINATLTNVSCNGLNNGAIAANISGVEPLSASWTFPNGSTNNNLSIDNLAPGIYTLSVSDGNNCNTNQTFEITQPDILDASETISNVLCANDSNGAISQIISGGTTPYSYQWSGPNGFTAGTRNVSGLTASTYTVIISDINGCSITREYEVAEPNELSASATITNPNCFNVNNGSIVVNPVGGTAPFSYQWVGSTNTTPNRNNLAPGQYTVIITDSNDCTFEETYAIESADEIIVSFDIDQSNCGLADGGITANANGGTGALLFSWTDENGDPIPAENGGNTNQIFDLASGNYTLTITDALGCSINETVLLFDNTDLTVNATITDIPCNAPNANVGRIILEISGGAEPLSFQWTGPVNRTTQNLLNVPAGDYNLVITDAAGCIFVENYTIQQFPDLFVVYDVTQPSCFGVDDGSISIVEVQGVNPNIPLVYNWNNDIISQTVTEITDLGPGNYFSRVRNGAPTTNCFFEQNFTLSYPQEISVDETITMPTCDGSANGSIVLDVSGGTLETGSTYTFIWSGPNGFSATTGNINNLAEGVYTVIVRDDNDCEFTETYELISPDPIVISVIDEVEPNCALADGSVEVIAIGGTAPYSFQWTNEVSGQLVPNTQGGNTAILVNVGASTYSVLVTDANGCTQSLEVTLSDNADIEIVGVIENETCVGAADGTITLSVNNGLEPFQFAWTGSGITSPNTQNQVGLSTGNYSVTVVDAAGCTEVREFTILPAEPIVITPSIVGVGCDGTPGSISINVSGGVEPYDFEWSGAISSSDQNLTNLLEGSYTVLVTDANNCSVSETFELELIEDIEISLLTNNGPDCEGADNGVVEIDITGGSGNFTFNWSGPDGFSANTQNIDGLAVGTYTLFVNDDLGCEANFNVTVEPGDGLQFSFVVDSPPTCPPNGVVTFNIEGGSGDFTYTYGLVVGAPTTQTGGNSITVSNLAAGIYNISIEDNVTGCIISDSFILNDISPLSAVTNITDANCLGNGGQINVVVSGVPFFPINRLIDSDNNLLLTLLGTNITFTDVSAGNYTIQTQFNNCVFSQEVTVAPSNLIDAVATIQDVDCFGEFSGAISLTNITGGDGNYGFSWTGPNSFTSSNQNIENLRAGNYQVIITDQQGCSSQFNFTIEQSNELVLDLSTENTSSCGVNDGVISGSALGGTAPYAFEIYNTSNGDLIATSLPANNIPAGIYDVVVIDANDCVAISTATINDPSDISINIIEQIVPDCGAFNGTLAVDILGATGPITITWTGPNGFTALNITSITNLESGTYTINVIDGAGCSFFESFNLGADEALDIELISLTNPSCEDSNNGAIEVLTTGGLGNYTFSWSGPNGFTADTESLNNLAAGTYNLLVTDELGCTAEASFTLSAGSLSVSVTVNSQPPCGFNSGSVTYSINGGSGDYTVTRVREDSQTVTFNSTGLTTDNNQGPGSFTVTVVDNVTGCTATTLFDVSSTIDLGLSVTPTDADCDGNGGSVSGSVTNAFGTVPVNLFRLSDNEIIATISLPGSGNFTFNNLAPGDYAVRVNLFACVNIESFTIGQPDDIELTAAVLNELCESEGNGAILISDITGGGGSTYTFNWTGPDGFTANTQSISNVSPGDYTLVVSTPGNCSNTFNFTVEPADEINLEATIINPIGCTDEGEIIPIVSGGTGNFEFELYEIQDGNSIFLESIPPFFVEAGIYNLVAIDENDCSATIEIIVTAEESNIELSLIDVQNPDCNANNGSITVEADGGQEPYIYTWSQSVVGVISNDNTISDLAAGTYFLEVVDQLGCQFFETFVLEGSDLIVDLVNTINPCEGNSNGAIEIDVIGGQGSLTFSWTGPNGFVADTQNLNNLEAGTYNLALTDSEGCLVEFSVTLEDDELSTTFVVNSPPTCIPTGNGSVTFTTVGGSGDYSYNLLSTANPTDVTFTGGSEVTRTNLRAASYTLIITDLITGCQNQIQFTLDDDVQFSLNVEVADASCEGGDGAVTLSTINPPGGSGVYRVFDENLTQLNVSINPPPVTFSNLPAGNYFAAVQFGLCSVQVPFTIGTENAIEAEAIVTNIDCFSSNSGAIEITSIIGGDGNYNFAWSGPDAFEASTQNIENLIAGSYTLIITDSGTCISEFNFEIIEPNPLEFNVVLGEPSDCGLADGSIIVTTSGGTSPITVELYDGNGDFIAANGNFSNLTAGVYFISVFDSNGCETSQTVTLNDPNLDETITLIDFINPNCELENGIIEIEVSGTPESIVWNGPGITNFEGTLLTNLAPGNYVVQVTYADGCSIFESFPLVDEGIQIDFVATQPSCGTSNDGSIEIDIIGGDGNFEISWTGPNGFEANNIFLLENLEAGTYTVNIIDGVGCEGTLIIELTPENDFSFLLSTTETECGAETGTISVTIEQGVGPYSLTLTTPEGDIANFDFESDFTILDLGAGLYTLTINDVTSGCSSTQSITINDVVDFTIEASITLAGCNNQNNGAILLDVIGTTPQSFIWTNEAGTNIASTQNLNNVPAGIYSVQVIDINGCSLIETFEIGSTQPITALFSVTNTLCFGDANGAISVFSIAGGNGNYNFNWTGPQGFGSTQQNIENLIAGNYTLTITDTQNCAEVFVVNVSQSVELGADITLDEPSSCGAEDGFISLAPTGGSAPYVIEWYDIEGEFITTGELLSGLGAGVYFFVVIDANGCTFESQAVLNDISDITVELVNAIDPTCALENGSIEITFEGGLGELTATWTGPGISGTTGSLIENLAVGTYTATITDSETDCQAFFSLTLIDSDLDVTAEITPAGCAGDENGAIELAVLGGNGNFTFNWTGPNGFTANTQNLEGLSAGIYNLFVTDTEGCFSELSFEVTQADEIEFTFNITPPSACLENDAQLEIEVLTGIEPFEVELLDAEGNQVGTGLNYTDLAPGLYTISIVDAEGCTGSEQIVINDPGAEEIVGTITNAACGINSGAIVLNLSNITVGEISWTGPEGFTASTPTIENLAGGIYNVQVTDANGCVSAASFNVFQGDALEIEITSENITCFGDNSGSIVVNVFSGIPPFNVEWTGPNGYVASGLNLTQLAPGIYNLNITDQTGCEQTATVEITAPDELLAEALITNSDCDITNGAILLVIEGGAEPYEIIWEDETLVGDNPTGLGINIYPVTIIDANGCELSLNAVVNSTFDGEVSAQVEQPTCPDNNDGSIEITLTGFTNPEINWVGPNGYTAENQTFIAGLLQGEYIVTITDETNCQFIQSFVLENDELPELSFQVVNVTCAGAADGSIITTVTGGNGPFTYSWTGLGGFESSEQNINNLAPGSYTLNVTDENGCSVQGTVEITAPTGVSISFAHIQPTCQESNGSLVVNPTGGTAPYSAVWTNQDGNIVGSGLTVNGVGAGIYFVQVFDANGCSNGSFTGLSDIEAFDLSFTVTNSDCNQDNGSIITEIISGDPDNIANISWTGASPNNQDFESDELSIEGLGQGIYNLVIEDINGCLTTATLFVDELEIEAILESITPVTCNGLADGSISISAIGGDGNYTYNWTGPNEFSATGASLENLAPGVYFVTITDESECSSTASFIIEEPSAVTVSFDITGATECGIPDGSAILSISGGVSETGNYLIQVSDQNGDPVFESDVDTEIDNLLSAVYNVIITDDNGCTLEIELLIPVDGFEFEADVVNPACEVASDGSITFTTFAPDANLVSINWTGPNGFTADELNISGLAQGEYTITAIDAEGCVYIQTFNLVAPPDGLEITFTVEPISCADANDGAITALTTSATAEFTWVGPNGFEAIGSAITDLAPGVYVVTGVTAEGCQGTAQIELLNPPAISIAASSQPADCGIENGSVTIVATGGTAPYQFSLNNLGGTELGTGQTISGLGSGVYIAIVTDVNGCSAQALVSITNPFAANVVSNIQNVSCPGADDGSVTLTLTGGNPPFIFNWVGPDGFTSFEQSLTNLGGGQYGVEITDSEGCVFSAVYNIFEAQPISIVGVPEDIDCSTGNIGGVNAFVSGGFAPLQFTWFDETNTVITTEQNLGTLIPGSYTLEVSDANGCTVSASYNINRINNFIANAGGPELFLFEGESIQLGGNPAGPEFANFSWSPPIALNNSGIPNPIASPIEDVVYTLTVSTDNSCESTDQVTVTVLPRIEFPTGFSPNGDGINDFWEIDRIDEYPNAVVEVYTRWGQLVFRSVGYSRPWNGTFNGEQLPIGTYYYIIDLKDVRFKSALTGPVTILR
jgi:gliding motility-associated-like protein